MLSQMFILKMAHNIFNDFLYYFVFNSIFFVCLFLIQSCQGRSSFQGQSSFKCVVSKSMLFLRWWMLYVLHFATKTSFCSCISLHSCIKYCTFNRLANILMSLCWPHHGHFYNSEPSPFPPYWNTLKLL